MRSILCGGIGCLLGAGAVWLAVSPGVRSHAPAPDLASVRTDDDTRSLAVPFLEATALRAAIREEVRGAVREEVAAAAAATPTKQGDEQPARTDEQPSPEPTAGYVKAREHVAQRLSAGTWSVADRDDMRDAVLTMNDRERQELMKQVILAVNQGKMRVELEGPLF
jgi:hypothetical protein